MGRLLLLAILCLPEFETSLYFSGSTCTTLGYGDVVFCHPCRLTGVVESLTDVLLMSWSAGILTYHGKPFV